MQPAKMLAEIQQREKAKLRIHSAVGIAFLTVYGGIAAFALYVMSTSTVVVHSGVESAQAAGSDATNSATLTWTAPGDDSNVGQATSYDIRYSTSPLDNSAWPYAAAVSSIPTPKTAGSTESLLVTGLQPNTTYYFGLTTQDDAGNISPLSNIASKTTAAVTIPACVESWSCSDWSACSSGTQTRTCTDSAACGTTSNKPATTQACTNAPAGGSEIDTVAPNTVLTATPTTTVTTPLFHFTWQGVDDVTGASSLEYSYQIDSWGWSGWTAKRGTTVRNLTNGIHTITVRSRDAAGNIDPSPVQASFTVALKSIVVTGVERGAQPVVRVYDVQGRLLKSFNAFEASFRGGVQVAVGDRGTDGQDEIIVASGPGRPTEIRLFRQDGSRIASFYPFGSRYTGGVTIAMADVDGDGPQEIVATKLSGSATVRMFGYRNGKNTQTFSEFNGLSGTQQNIAAGDLDGDGKDEIITAPARRGASTVRVFGLRGSALKLLGSTPNVLASTTGLSIATGDTDNDGRAELIVGPAANAKPTVRIGDWNGSQFKLVRQYFLAFRVNEQAGVRLSAVDTNADGYADVLASYGTTVRPTFRAFSGKTYQYLKTVPIFGSRDRLVLSTDSGT